MKTTLKILLLSCLIGIMAFSCEKEKQTKWSGFVDGYVVATFKCYKSDTVINQETGKETKRGYFILLEGKQHTKSNWPVDFYTFNMPDSLFRFPAEIILKTHDDMNCGPIFFPDSLRTKYKIRFQYRKLKENEKNHFDCGCYAMSFPFPWKEYGQVSVKDVSKIIH